MLFFGYFSFLIVAFTAVAMWLVATFTNSTLPKRQHPRPPIDQTVTPEQIAPLHLQATKKEASATDDVSPVKHHKRKVVARQRNNDYGYGNVWGYAQAYRNDPRGFWR